MKKEKRLKILKKEKKKGKKKRKKDEDTGQRIDSTRDEIPLLTLPLVSLLFPCEGGKGNGFRRRRERGRGKDCITSENREGMERQSIKKKKWSSGQRKRVEGGDQERRRLMILCNCPSLFQQLH